MGGGYRVKSLICEEFQEAMRGVNSKEGPKGKFFAFLDQERDCCQGPKAHPLVVRSNCSERYVTEVKKGPMLCPRTPRANSCLSEM
jgi:hypothetical protein